KMPAPAAARPAPARRPGRPQACAPPPAWPRRAGAGPSAHAPSPRGEEPADLEGHTGGGAMIVADRLRGPRHWPRRDGPCAIRPPHASSPPATRGWQRGPGQPHCAIKVTVVSPEIRPSAVTVTVGIVRAVPYVPAVTPVVVSVGLGYV